MFQWFALFDRIWTQAGTWLLSARGQTISVLVLLTTQAGLLAYSATRHSPTHLEPAFLAAGISHWQFGRFELYRVNPPLPRMIAALPVLAVGCKADWSRYYDAPGSRAEFPVGEDFIKANGSASIPLFFYARWACIPFFLIGGYFAYRWANELYGNGAGLVTLVLWTFEPNLLGHAELVTPDCACWSFGVLAGYTFWRWLKSPSWMRAGIAGLSLGLAELSKMSWIILFGLWPLLWLAWKYNGRHSAVTSAQTQSGGECVAFVPVESTSNATFPAKSQAGLVIGAATNGTSDSCARRLEPPSIQLASILLIAVYLINIGYAFDGTGTTLNELVFVSTSLTGLDIAGQPGNRFESLWLGQLPIPLPKQYVLGFDSQKKDLEDFPQRSYLRGEWKFGGWWYYYIYGLLIKVPCGAWFLFAQIVLTRFLSPSRPLPCRDELVLLAPAVTLLLLVSSQTVFNIHLRYVFPSLGLSLFFLGQATRSLSRRFSFSCSMLTTALIGHSVISTMSVYPHHLAYFNDFVGGPMNGHHHLLGSSFDWGQDLLYMKRDILCLQTSAQLSTGIASADVVAAASLSRLVPQKWTSANDGSPGLWVISKSRIAGDLVFGETRPPTFRRHVAIRDHRVSGYTYDIYRASYRDLLESALDTEWVGGPSDSCCHSPK